MHRVRADIARRQQPLRGGLKLIAQVVLVHVRATRVEGAHLRRDSRAGEAYRRGRRKDAGERIAARDALVWVIQVARAVGRVVGEGRVEVVAVRNARACVFGRSFGFGLIEEQGIGAADALLSIAARIEREPDARRKVGQLLVHDAVADAGVPRKQQAGGRVHEDLGRDACVEVRHGKVLAAIVGVVGRKPRLPAQAGVDYQLLVQVVGVLHVVAEIILAQVQQVSGGVGLEHVGGGTQKEVCYREA